MQMLPSHPDQLPLIIDIISHAQTRLKQAGIDQWQDNYPNPSVLQQDLAQGTGYLLWHGTQPAAYVSLSFEAEPNYTLIEQGSWQSAKPYGTIHRLAVAQGFLNQKIATQIMSLLEKMTLEKGIYWLRADTHTDNLPMKALLQRAGFCRRGIVYMRGTAIRQAYEKGPLSHIS